MTYNVFGGTLSLTQSIHKVVHDVIQVRWKTLHDFVANLFRTLLTKCRQNRPSFVEDITKKHFGLCVSGHSVYIIRSVYKRRRMGFVKCRCLFRATTATTN